MRGVAVLCTRENSHYLKAGVECYDSQRDAYSFDPMADDRLAIVAHPPCAQWGILRALSNYNPREKNLGPWCVCAVQLNGGVLEHPRGSRLFHEMGLPLPGDSPDIHGGVTIEVDQLWWGYPCQKRTWFYCVRTPSPICPLSFARPTHVIDTTRRDKKRLPFLPKSRRSETVPALCQWLIDLASQSTLKGHVKK
jgi:hypothetical protein